jgi:hypothetical protein
MTYEDFIERYDISNHDRGKDTLAGFWPVYERLYNEGFLRHFSFIYTQGMQRERESRIDMKGIIVTRELTRNKNDLIAVERLSVRISIGFNTIHCVAEKEVRDQDSLWYGKPNTRDYTLSTNVPGAVIGFLRDLPVEWPT